MAEETILLNVKIDQSDAQKQLVQTEKNLLNLKKQQAELSKEYKAGKISQDEYVKSNLSLQKAIKNETDQKRTLTRLVETESNSRNALKLRVSELTKEYDNLNKYTTSGAKRADELQKELSELNAEITKSSKSAGLFKDQIGNYPQALSQAATAVVPFGQNIQGATASLGKFGPVAAVAGAALSGLVGLYAQSAEGARDLEFAQNLVSSSVDILANNIGDFVAGEGDEQIGLFSRLTGQLLAYLDTSTAVEAAIQAAAKQRIGDLEISRALAQAAAKEDERRAENARRIRDDESKDLQERLAQVQTIDETLSRSAQRSVTVIQAQINAIKESTTNYEKNRQAQLQVAQLEAEIADKQEEINGKLTENVTARRTILKLIEEERKLTAADDRAQRRALETTDITPESVREEAEARIGRFSEDIGDSQIAVNKSINDRLLKENEAFYKRDLAAKKKAAQLKQQVDEAQVYATQSILGAIGSLFDQQSDEYKALASAQVLISTYSAATKAYEAAFLPLPTVASPALGAAFAAAAIAQGLANLANINGIQFAEGGFTGAGGKYEPAGVVHKGEYVVPQSVNYSPAAQPHIAALENMRVKGYADGGFVTSQNISPFQMAMITANAIKNMPAPVVSWREGQKVGQRVEWREQTSQR